MQAKSQIRIVILFSIIAFLLSTGVLMWGWVSSSCSMGGKCEQLSIGDWANISMAISSVFVLVIGIIGITLLATVETSDYKLAEKVKDDIAKLLSTLAMINFKSNGQIQANIDDELEIIDDFLLTPTFLAVDILLGKNYKKDDDSSVSPLLFKVKLTTIKSHPKKYSALLIGDLENIIDDTFIGDIIEQVSDASSLVSNYLLYSETVRTIIENNKDEERQQAEETKKQVKILQGILNSGIQDPNIDMFLAAMTDDGEGVKKALENGGDISATMGDIKQKYSVFFI